MKKAIRSIITVLVLMLLTVSGLLLFKNTNTAKDEDKKDISKVNIALVNEDAGTTYNKQSYNIGKNYVDGASQDEKYNWSVVSRAVAENGLNNGDYNLLIVIPSDFSQNILSINSTAPKTEGLTYKINGKGNKELESRTKSIGEKIISQLDKKLINVYMASILTNLYTAQQNVQKVVDNQGEHILGLNNQVVDPLATHQDSINELDNQTSDIKDTTGSFTDTLNNFIETTSNNYESNKSFSDDLNAIIQEKHSDDVNYADFVSKMMELNNGVVDKDTDNLFKAVSANRNIFNNLFGTDGSFNAHLNDVEQEIQQNSAKLEAFKKDVLSNYDNQDDSNDFLNLYFGGEKYFDNLTVNEFLNKFEDDNSNMQKPDTFVKNILDFSNGNTKLMPKNSSEILKIKNQLSLLNDDDFNNIYNESLNVEKSVNSIKSSKIIFDNTDSWKNDLINAYNNLEPIVDSEFSQYITDATDVESVVAPDDIAVDGLYSGNQSIATKITGNRIQILSDTNEGLLIKYHIKPSNLNSKISDNWVLSYKDKNDSNISVDYMGYAQKLGKAISDYQRALSDLHNNFKNSSDSLRLVNMLEHKDSQSSDDVGDTKIAEYLRILLNGFDKKQMLNVFSYFSDLDNLSKNMNATSRQLQFDNIRAISATTALNNDVDEQLTLLQQWKTQVELINSSEDEYNEVNQKLGTDLDEKNNAFKELIESSNSINDSAKENAKSSDEITKTITGYREAVTNAKSIGDKLVENTKSVKGQFDNENSDDRNFSHQFSGVLANANTNGATNDKLLGFLVSPVKGSSKATIQQATINVPYKIILVMFVLAIATTLIIDKLNMKFKKENTLKESSYFENNIPKTIANLVVSVVIGFLAGLVIRSSYGIGAEAILPLMTFFVFYQVLFGLFNHILLKLFKMYGIGISLLMVIVFALTSDLGLDMQSMSFVQKVFFGINPLISMQRVMMTFFTQSTNIWVQLVEVLIVSILIFIVVIFMNNPKFKIYQKKVSSHD